MLEELVQSQSHLVNHLEPVWSMLGNKTYPSPTSVPLCLCSLMSMPQRHTPPL